MLLGTEQVWQNLVPQITDLTSLWKCGKNRNLISNPATNIQMPSVFFSEEQYQSSQIFQEREEGKNQSGETFPTGRAYLNLEFAVE